MVVSIDTGLKCRATFAKRNKTDSESNLHACFPAVLFSRSVLVAPVGPVRVS